MFNRVLNESVVASIKDAETFGKTWSNYEKIEEGAETLNGVLWFDVVAKTALGGLTDNADDMLSRVADYEKAASESHGVPRQRKARASIAATDFVVPPTFKSYKSTIKGAIEHGVELLDANGLPRSRNDVSEDLKEAKKVEKTDEEKLGYTVDTFLAVYAKCSDAHPLTIDAVNKLVNALQARGVLPNASLAA